MARWFKRLLSRKDTDTKERIKNLVKHKPPTEDELEKDIERVGLPRAFLEHLGKAGMFDMLYMVLHEHPAAENYMIVPIRGQDNAVMYNLILHKAGKRLPTEEQVAHAGRDSKES